VLTTVDPRQPHYGRELIAPLTTTLAEVCLSVPQMATTTQFAFHSRTFKDTETNYDIHDKELMAIYDAFKHWQHYHEWSWHLDQCCY